MEELVYTFRASNPYCLWVLTFVKSFSG